MTGWQAVTWPAEIDVFLIVGELALYIAYLDNWTARHKLWPWTTALLGLTVSVIGNIGHIRPEPGIPVSAVDRLTAGTSPLAAFAGLAIALLVLKQTQRRPRSDPVSYSGAADHPQAGSQQREAGINPYVVPVAPALLWRVTIAGWDVLGFEHVEGHHADLSPGSPDLPKIAAALTRLHAVAAPDLPLRRLEDRWSDHVPDEQHRAHLRGDGLLHTDLNPGNILITKDSAKLIDWAWPTLGPSWIDPACLALWMIHAGHAPAEAEAWIGTGIGEGALGTFTAANTRLWTEIADNDPSPWKRSAAAAAQRWHRDRTERRGDTPRPVV